MVLTVLKVTIGKRKNLGPGVTALKPDLKPNLTSVAPSYDRKSSGFRCTVVQLYDISKTQNVYNFGHGHATDL